jgi:hypothetical protein
MGPPGPQGIPGPIAEGGPFLPLTGGTVSGNVTLGANLSFANAQSFPSGATTGALRLFSDNSVSGTGTTGTGYLHRFVANSDQAQFTGGGVNGMTFFDLTHNFGGGATQGWRTTMAITQTQIAATANKVAGVNPIGVALIINDAVQVNDGGTGLQHPSHANATALPWNATTAVGIQSTLYSAASYQSGQAGMEIDIGGHPGSSALSKKALMLVKWSYDSYQSPIDDCAIFIGDQGGASVGWTTGIRFGSSIAQWPIDMNNGAIMNAVYSQPVGAVQAQARYGIDFSDVAFPAFGTTRVAGFLSSNNFGVDGVGAVMLGSTYLTPTGTGLSVDAKGLISTGASVAAGGSGYSVGDVLYDPFGGIYRVATITGSAVATVTPYTDVNGNPHRANYPAKTAPANPIATTAWDFAANIAFGCTLNLTWNTTATILALQESGGLTTLGGGLITSGSSASQFGSGSGTINLNIQPAGGVVLATATGGGAIAIDGGGIVFGWGSNPYVRFNSTACFTANGTKAVSLTALAPAAASATVVEWLTIQDAAGNTRYIPCF